jgi:hypothetical protein
MLFWTRTGLISLVRPGKYDYEFGFALPPMKTPDKNFQYMMVAAEPYQTCGFKLQAREMDRKAPLYRRVFEIAILESEEPEDFLLLLASSNELIMIE